MGEGRRPTTDSLLVLLHSELRCVGSTYLCSSVKVLRQAGLKEKIPCREWETFNLLQLWPWWEGTIAAWGWARGSAGTATGTNPGRASLQAHCTGTACCFPKESFAISVIYPVVFCLPMDRPLRGDPHCPPIAMSIRRQQRLSGHALCARQEPAAPGTDQIAVMGHWYHPAT